MTVQEVVTLEDIATTNEQISGQYLDGFLNSIMMLFEKSLCVIMFSNTIDSFLVRIVYLALIHACNSVNVFAVGLRQLSGM
jgi:hypothetical protein